MSYSNLHVGTTVLDRTAHMVRGHLQVLAMEDHREQMLVVQILSEINWETRRKRDILMPICFPTTTMELDQSTSCEEPCGEPASAGLDFLYLPSTGDLWLLLFSLHDSNWETKRQAFGFTHTLYIIPYL